MKDFGQEHRNEMKRSSLMKKLLCVNGRETKWKREIERGTVVKTPCCLLRIQSIFGVLNER
jgi:hypothetical protein